MMNLIKGLKYYCKYKSEGCQEAYKIGVELAKHEAFCGFKGENEARKEETQYCNICNKSVNSLEQSHGKHFCENIEEQWCSDHQKSGIFFNDTRIVNYASSKKQIDLFRCGLCTNLVRYPYACQHCKKNFCRFCLSNALANKNYCPSCYTFSPEVSECPRYLLPLLNKFSITCKNEACNQTLAYDQVEKHESVCDKCPNCMVKCAICLQIMLPEDK